MTSGDTLNQEKPLVQDDATIPLEVAARYRIVVLILSFFTIVALLVLGAVTLAYGVILQSSASMAFAVDAFLDCISSTVVIWRYMGADASVYSRRREKLACVALGMLFLVSAGLVAVKAVLSLVDDDTPEENDTLWVIGVVAGVLCTLFSFGKLLSAYKLRCWSVLTDAFNSVIGAILAFSLVLSEWVYSQNPNVWYLDPVVGLVCSIFLVVYGIWLILYNLRGVKKMRDSEQSSELLETMSQ